MLICRMLYKRALVRVDGEEVQSKKSCFGNYIAINMVQLFGLIKTTIDHQTIKKWKGSYLLRIL